MKFWWKNELRLNTIHELTDLNICNLYFFYIKFQTSDSGQYRCTARNERGEASLTMNLDITSKVSVGKHFILLYYSLHKKFSFP